MNKVIINDEKADKVEMPQKHISTYSLAETFMSAETRVRRYQTSRRAYIKFNGKLDGAIFTVSDDNTVPPRELPAIYY